MNGQFSVYYALGWLMFGISDKFRQEYSVGSF